LDPWEPQAKEKIILTKARGVLSFEDTGIDSMVALDGDE
jgi:hypothetical protein